MKSNLGIPEHLLPLIKRPLERPVGVVEVVVVEMVLELPGGWKRDSEISQVSTRGHPIAQKSPLRIGEPMGLIAFIYFDLSICSKAGQSDPDHKGVIMADSAAQS